MGVEPSAAAYLVALGVSIFAVVFFCVACYVILRVAHIIREVVYRVWR